MQYCLGSPTLLKLSPATRLRILRMASAQSYECSSSVPAVHAVCVRRCVLSGQALSFIVLPDESCSQRMIDGSGVKSKKKERFVVPALDPEAGAPGPPHSTCMGTGRWWD